MKPTNRGRGELWVVGQFVLLAAILLSPSQIAGLPAWPEGLRWAGAALGLALGLAGVGVALAAARTLGASLTPFPRPRDGATLVQHGIYGVVRHPIYSGIVLGALGWSLLRASLPSLLLTLALALFFDRKARREEAWLLEAYPGYREYMARVRRRVW